MGCGPGLGGERSLYAGQNQVGGTFNPSLAGCEATIAGTEDGTDGAGDYQRAFIEERAWDSEGQLLREAVDGAETTWVWVNGCITEMQSSNEQYRAECDAMGFPIAGTLGNEDFEWANKYDSEGILASRTFAANGGEASESTYSWSDGRIVAIESNIEGSSSTTFEYNEEGWLTGSVVGDSGFTYAYDANGRVVEGQSADFYYFYWWTYEGAALRPATQIETYVGSSGTGWSREGSYVWGCEG